MRAKGGAMMTAPHTRPRRNGFTAMQRSNLCVLLRVLYREHGSWIGVARALRMRRTSVESFYYDERPGNLAIARAIAKATALDLEVALDGRFVITDKGVKAIGVK
jgi:hypothetical protein